MTQLTLLNSLRKESYIIHLKSFHGFINILKTNVLNPKAYSILLEQVQVSTQHTVHTAAVSRISSPKQRA